MTAHLPARSVLADEGFEIVTKVDRVDDAFEPRAVFDADGADGQTVGDEHRFEQVRISRQVVRRPQVDVVDLFLCCSQHFGQLNREKVSPRSICAFHRRSQAVAALTHSTPYFVFLPRDGR